MKTAEYIKISAQQAKEIMDKGDPFILIDARTNDEYAKRHIEGAVLIPHGAIKARAGDELPDKDALIFVYCQSGGRSKFAAKELVGMGYTNVFDIGGLIDWPY